MSGRRVFVIQPGARLHYAMPQLFAEAGTLAGLYTDLHADHDWLRAIDGVVPRSAQPRMLRRLLGRRLPAGLPAALVHDRPIETFARGIADAARLRQWGARHLPAALLRDLEASDVGEGDLVYTVLINEDLETMDRLKQRGARIVHECIIGPDVGLLIEEESRRFPGLEPAPELGEVQAGRARDAAKYALSDLILVPSTFTAAAVQQLNQTDTPVANVPYGFDLTAYANTQPRPEIGRVLFVGSVGLRKGNPDLAEASRMLAPTDPQIGIRVVGPGTPAMFDAAVLRGPHYVGQVPRTQMAEEYARADIFVLPTICDSFGIVLLEAMSLGIPVITTPNCGDIVRHGIDGFVVPPRDPRALADLIRELVGNRPLRERMSANARERVMAFSLAAYRDRLFEALASVA